MSGIAGLWHLDQRPVERDVLARMSRALQHRGRDGAGCRIAGPVGFAHQRLWVTPEEQGEMQPLVGRGGIMLVMDGRLDNRDELLSALSASITLSDAACVLAAFERWGEGFAARLNGDFAVAIFDPQLQRLLLARDSIGIRPLYHLRTDAHVLFASEIKALLAHPDVTAAADDEGLADYLLVSSRPVDEQQITCFKGISAIVPAHVAIATRERLITRRYWDFDPSRRLRLRSSGEYAEAYREHFEKAVRRRIRAARVVAVSVSGGLDSTSIYAQARSILGRTPDGHPGILGISHLGPHGTDADEHRYVHAVESELHERIDAFPMSPLAGIACNVHEQMEATEAPLVDYMWGITRELHRRAAAHRSRLLLTGHWGDQVLFSSAYFVDLLCSLKLRTLARHLRAQDLWWGRAEARALPQRFALDLGRHLLPGHLQFASKWLRRRLSRRAQAKRWFTSAFLGRALRFADRPSTLGAGFHSAQARAIYLEARSKHHVHCMEWHNKASARTGLDAAFPFLDRDLLAFLMAIPGEAQNPNGVPRGLAREAMRGVLPETVRTRASKADFSRFVNDGIAADVATIAAEFSRDPVGVRLGYLEAGALASSVETLSRGLSRDDCLDAWDLADIYGLEVWLRVFLTPHQRTSSQCRGMRSAPVDEDDEEAGKENGAARREEGAISHSAAQDPR